MQSTFLCHLSFQMFTTYWHALHAHFTVVDLCSAFFSVPVHEDTQPLFAFTHRNKQYTWTRLPQGMIDSPAAFSMVVRATLDSFTPPGLYWMTSSSVLKVKNYVKLLHTCFSSTSNRLATKHQQRKCSTVRLLFNIWDSHCLTENVPWLQTGSKLWPPSLGSLHRRKCCPS